MQMLHDPPSTHSFASLTRAPSLRSVAVLRCAQSPSFAALSPWLRHAAGFACGLFVFEAAGFACGSNTLTRCAQPASPRLTGSFKIELAPVRCGPRERASNWGSDFPRRDD